MSYSSWLADTNKYSSPNYSYLPSGFPIDYRTLQENVSAVYELDSQYRYPGLKAYVVANGIEYVFNPSINATTGKMSFPNSGITEYHPELVHVGIVDPDNRPVKPDSEPAEYYTDAELLRNPTVLLGDGIVTYSNKSYNTIPEGAEGTLKTTDNKYYKYVWNGENWVMFANSGSGSNTVILNFASDVDMGDDPNNPVYKTSICDLTSSDISSAYKEAMGLDEQEEPASGSEANVVFTDNTSGTPFEYCRKYVYLNNEWLIVQGVQEYVVSIPAYSTSWLEYDPSSGLSVIKGDSDDIDIKRSNTDGYVDIIINHKFNSPYVDAFVFEKKDINEDVDGDETTNDTEYGERLIVPVICVKSTTQEQGQETGEVKFKVKTTLPVSSSATTTYAITLQK